MRVTRRDFVVKLGSAVAAAGLFPSFKPLKALADNLTSESSPIPTRPLGRTGHNATLFSLGGEGVLRTRGRLSEAVPVIQKALELGVNYFDTAPAYDQSQDYYGAALRDQRKRIFLAAKTHDRSRDGSLALLEDSLQRLKTDHLDLWQLHDLRTFDDLERIFSRGGALEALDAAKAQKMVRFFGVTGHHDPEILLEAMRRYPFDTVLCPVNAGDRRRLSFIDTVVRKAHSKRMGVIGMKVTGRTELLNGPGPLTMREALYYALSQPVSTVIIGCWTPQQVEENVRLAKAFKTLSATERTRIEKAAANKADAANFFKKE